MKNLPVAELYACVNTRNANRVTVRCGTRLVAFAPGELLLLDVHTETDDGVGWRTPVGRCCRVTQSIAIHFLGREAYPEAVWPDVMELVLGR